MKHQRSTPLCFLVVLSFFLVSRVHAATWLPFGPDGGDARAFAADPKDPRHMFLGAANGWIYQSHDAGHKWERLASVGKRDDLVIDNILVDPADPTHVVVGAWKLVDLSHPDGGIFVSHDGGLTWVSQPQMAGKSVLALTSAPSDQKIMVAGTMEGVFRSTDSGANWQLISPAGSQEIHEVESVAIDPTNPNIMFAGTWHLPWKTTDGGAHWSSMKQGLIEDSDVFSIIVDSKQPSVVYLSACSGIYKSEDGGEKFKGGVSVNKTQGIPATARRTRVLMQDPNHRDTVFAGTTEGLYRTDDAGHTWKLITGPEVIVNDVFVDPTDSKRVLLATDRGGVLASDDNGRVFQSSTAGFSTRQITAFVADRQHPATVYVGVVNDKELGGVFVSQSGGLNWSQSSSGLGGRDVYALGQAQDGMILAGTSHGIFQLKNGAWQRAVLEIKPIIKKPAPAKTIKKAAPTKAKLAPVSFVTKSEPAAKAAVKRVAPKPVIKPFDGSVYSFALTGGTLYAATSQGLLSSDSNGEMWSAVLPAAKGEYRYVAATGSKILAAGLNMAQVSTDDGATWRTAVLPDGMDQISAVGVDGEGNFWMGGRLGAFYSADSGATWKTFPELPIRNPVSLYFDAAANRMLVTASRPSTVAFAVQLPSMKVTSWDTGWDLRFVRQVGDYMIAGTLYDGVVVQPKMAADTAQVAPRTSSHGQQGGGLESSQR